MCHKTGNPLRYQCGECFYSCDKSDHFKRHIMTHTGERPHLCPFCNRRFTDKSNFNRHVRIHTRNKNLCF
ncbi:Zinc finger protein 500, partial [Stegodyphus mimosarum]